MNKELTPLEALKEIERFIGKNIDSATVEDSCVLGSSIVIIEKSLKALEIIKSKKISVGKLYINTHEHRVSKYISIYDITDKELDLLKEVLK